jgi:hypothetical protein
MGLRGMVLMLVPGVVRDHGRARSHTFSFRAITFLLTEFRTSSTAHRCCVNFSRA